MNFKSRRRWTSWLLMFCMTLSVFWGVMPEWNTVQAATLINVNGNKSEGAWQVAESLGKGSCDREIVANDVNKTSLGDLYFTNDLENLYFWIDMNVPNWGANGMFVDLALQVQGQGKGLSESASGNQFIFSKDKEPNYQLVMHVEGDKVGQSILTGVTSGSAYVIDDTKSTTSSMLNIKGDREVGIEGSIKLEALDLQVGSKIAPMVVLSGNTPGEHGAFNVIPEAPGNELTASWNESVSPNSQSVYAKSYTIIEPKESELEVVINDDGTITVTRKASTDTLYLMGELTDWNSGAQMTKTGDGKFTYTTPKKVVAGSYEFKFRPNKDNWDGELTGDKLIVPGLIMPEQMIEKDSSFKLPEQVAFLDEMGERYQVSANYELLESAKGVTLTGGNLRVTSDFNGNQISLKVTSSKVKDEIVVPVYIKETVYSYEINYYRPKGDYTNWNIWDTKRSIQCDFSEKIQDECVVQTIRTAEPQFDFMIRKGSWDQKDVDVTRTLIVPNNQKEVEVWLVQGSSEVFYEKPDFDEVSKVQKRYIVFEYIRPEKDYEDWNIWTWFTGVKDGQVDFVDFKEGRAIGYIEVGPTTEKVGFKVRKGDSWAPGTVDYNVDRLIPTALGEVVTKVKVVQDTPEIVTLLPALAPQFDIPNKQIKFTYRDDKLFKLGNMTDIESVKVEVNGKDYEMSYDTENEMFKYTYEGLQPGKYLYCYKVTYKDGRVETLLDKKNNKTEDEKSLITYSKMDIEVSASVDRSFNFREHGILTVDAKAIGKDEGKKVKISKITVDLTALGGKKDVIIDKDLKEMALSVAHNIKPGIKKIPIQVYDDFSNVYETIAVVKVLSPTHIPKDHFDWDEAVIYFMLTDRFYNGDTSNDDPVGNGYKKEDRGAYQGGDLKGITEKLDYLKALGVNTLWISPVVDNIDFNVLAYNNNYETRPEVGNDVSYYGYHGYWAKNFEKLNPHFGSLDDFHKLIDAAHEKDMKIMVDVVINHTGYGLQVADNETSMGGPKDLKNYPILQDKTRFEGMLRTDHSSDAVYGELDPGLSDFITENPEVRKKILRWQTDWVEHLAKTDKGNTIDYFRVDTAKHVDPATLQAFKTALVKVKPDFRYTSEAWLNGKGLDDFLDRGSTDAVLNFDFKGIAHAFIEGRLDEAEDNLEKLNAKATSVATYGNFLGSHDEDGFLYSLGMDQTDKLKVAATLEATSKGQPVIYYGEEVGQSGANNWPYYDNRYNFDWNIANENNDILTHYQKVFNIRKAYSELFARGTRRKIAGGDQEEYLAFERSYGEDRIVVVVNNKNKDVTIKLKVPYKPHTTVKDVYSGKHYEVSSSEEILLNVPATMQGGTSILVKEKDPSSNNSHSSSGGASSQNTVTEVKGEKELILIDEKEFERAPLEQGIKVIKIDTKKDIAGISLSEKVIERLLKDKVQIQVELGETVLNIPAGAFDQSDLKQAQKLIIKAVPFKEIKNKEVRRDNQYTLIGDSISLTMQTVREGKEENINKIQKPITVSIKLTDKQILSIKDKRKAGIYFIPTSGKTEFLGGTFKENIIQTQINHLGDYAVMVYDKTFTDLDRAIWAKDYIEVLAARHIAAGKTGEKFDPTGTITRAEMAVLLGKALNIKPEINSGKFADVKEETWYSGYMIALNKLGIINGYNDGTFRPNQKITRQEMAVLITAAYAYCEGENLTKIVGYEKTSFADITEVAPWAVTSVKAANAIGLIRGDNDNNYSPNQTATRAEMATILVELLGKTGAFK